jgi:hypothetical protein
VVTGVLVLRERPLGYVLAPSLLVATFFLALGILSLMVVSAVRGLEATAGVGVAVGILALFEAVTVVRLLGSLDQAVATKQLPTTEVE